MEELMRFCPKTFLVKNMNIWQALVNTSINLWASKQLANFLTRWETTSISIKILLPDLSLS